MNDLISRQEAELRDINEAYCYNCQEFLCEYCTFPIYTKMEGENV